MTQQSLNLGSNANDGSGDDLRSAMTKVQANFTDLYTNVNELLGETAVNSQISFAGNKISTNVSNADLVLEASSTGDIILAQLTLSITRSESTFTAGLQGRSVSGDDWQEGFSIDIPSATNSCGCGDSFSM